MSSAPMRDVLWMHGARSRLRELLDTAHKEGGRFVMVDESAERTEARLSGHAGLSAEINANGSLRRFDCGDISLSLFVGNELEGGPANLYLRMVGDGARCIPLLGPHAPTWFETDPKSGRCTGTGSWLVGE